MDRGEVYARIAQMREAATTINRSAAHIQDCMDAVDNEVRTLGADRFMSIGAESFRSEYNRLTPRLREAFDSLIRFHDKLDVSADDIEAASRLSK
jgi:WXG100 family type VII secretion target